MKFVVVDDNETFREGIIFYLENILNYKVIGKASNGREFLEQKQILKDADIVLMDVQMPEIDGIEAVMKFLRFYQNTKIIAVTDFPNAVYLKELIYTGFKACVFKNRVFEDLPAAIENVIKGKLHFPENVRIEDGEFTSNTLE